MLGGRSLAFPFNKPVAPILIIVSQGQQGRGCRGCGPPKKNVLLVAAHLGAVLAANTNNSISSYQHRTRILDTTTVQNLIHWCGWPLLQYPNRYIDRRYAGTGCGVSHQQKRPRKKKVDTCTWTSNEKNVVAANEKNTHGSLERRHSSTTVCGSGLTTVVLNVVRTKHYTTKKVNTKMRFLFGDTVVQLSSISQ